MSSGVSFIAGQMTMGAKMGQHAACRGVAWWRLEERQRRGTGLVSCTQARAERNLNAPSTSTPQHLFLQTRHEDPPPKTQFVSVLKRVCDHL